MSRTEPVELTVLCLLHRGDRYLLQNRLKADWHGYALPGGHVEPGESVVETVIREMREETGYRILSPRLCGLKQFPIPGGRYLVFLFTAEQWEGTLHDSQEGAMRWVSRGELSGLPTVDDLETLIDLMLSGDKTAFQYVPDGDDWQVVLR